MMGAHSTLAESDGGYNPKLSSWRGRNGRTRPDRPAFALKPCHFGHDLILIRRQLYDDGAKMFRPMRRRSSGLPAPVPVQSKVIRGWRGGPLHPTLRDGDYYVVRELALGCGAFSTALAPICRFVRFLLRPRGELSALPSNAQNSPPDSYPPQVGF